MFEAFKCKCGKPTRVRCFNGIGTYWIECGERARNGAAGIGALRVFDGGLRGRHVQKVDSSFVTTGYAASDGVRHDGPSSRAGASKRFFEVRALADEVQPTRARLEIVAFVSNYGQALPSYRAATSVAVSARL